MGNDIVIGVDVAKSVFEMAVSDRPGHVCKRARPSRHEFLTFFLAYPKARVVMEACGSAHYWGRDLQKRGPRGRAPASASRATVRSREQDRPHGCQGHPGGLSQCGYPSRAREVCVAAVTHGAAP